MDNELYLTLENLKDTLSEISSAREQVTNTVNAYAKTQKNVQGYIDKLDGVEHCLEKIITLLQNNKAIIDKQSIIASTNLKSTCDKVIESINAKLTDVTKSFSQQLQSNLNIMSQDIKVFDNTIKEAGTFINSIETILNSIAQIEASVNVLQQEFSSSQKEHRQTLGHIDQAIQSLTDENLINHTATHNKLDRIKELNDYNTRLLGNIKSNLEQTSNDIKSEIYSATEDVRGEIMTNRYIGLIALILLIIMAVSQWIAI